MFDPNNPTNPNNFEGDNSSSDFSHINEYTGYHFSGFDPSEVTPPEVKPEPAAEEPKKAEAEYHYTASELPHSNYADARYTPSVNSYSQPRYHYAEPEKKAEKKRRGPGWGAAIAMCLVCALLGGTVAGLIARDSGSVSEPEASVNTPMATAPIAITPAPQTSSTNPLISGGSSGSALTPNQIYTQACTNAVGITTEITYTSFFGTTSAPVSGSGFIVSADGYILTNFHVIEEAYEGGHEITVMLYNGESYIASIVGFEEDNDVAVLKIEAEGLTPAVLGNSDDIQVGDAVYPVGNPLGELTFTMTSGMVGALDREISSTDSSTGVTTTINMFQIDAAVNSGNSGGPVYNDEGEVIGIVTAKYSSTGVEGLGFAIPINDAISIANELIEKGYVGGKAYFGITVQTVSSSAAQYYNMAPGAYIYALDPNSCANTAGLKIGDIITKLDDAEIASSSDLIAAKKNYHAGDTAVVTVYRSGEYLELSITFDEEVPSSSGGTAQAPQNAPNTQGR